MSKQLFANEKVMSQYLGALLCEDEPTEKLKPVAKLLERIPDDAKSNEVKQDDIQVLKTEQTGQITERVENVFPEPIETVQDTLTVEVAVAEQAKTSVAAKTESDYYDGQFQALYFEVAGLTLAVPLKALGGIHQLTEVTHLFGKPKWFKGVMLNRDEKLNVVDTARWVMPEKYDEKLEASLDYKYLITLGDSQWGLLAEKLINNITLNKEDVKWRTDKSKRPWLAGVIKEKMCALIDVDNLNTLLEEGLDSRQ